MENQTLNPTPNPEQTFVNASALSRRILETILKPDFLLEYYIYDRGSYITVANL